MGLLEILMIVTYLILTALLYLKMMKTFSVSGEFEFYSLSMLFGGLVITIISFGINFFLLETIILINLHITLIFMGILLKNMKLGRIVFVSLSCFFFAKYTYFSIKDIPLYITGNYSYNEGVGYLVEKRAGRGSAEFLLVNDITHNLNCFSCNVLSSDNYKIFGVTYLPNSERTLELNILE